MCTSSILSCNDKSLLKDGFYGYISTTTTPDQRVITKYCLRDQEEATYKSAIEVLKTFLNDNPPLCATFSTEALEKKIKKNPFLVVNGHAVSLAKSKEDEKAPEYKDEYFTGTILKNPIRCSKGHLLEKNRFAFWEKKYPNSCPAGSDHTVVLFEIDSVLKTQIDSCKTTRTEKKNSLQNLLKTNKSLGKEVEKLKKERKLLQRNRELTSDRLQEQRSLICQLKNRVNPITAVGSLCKLIMKCGDQRICIKGLEWLLKDTGTKIGLSFVKKFLFLVS